MHDNPRDVDFDDEFEPRDEVSSDEIISAAVAEAKRHVRRNELKTNSALDALSEWMEKSEQRRFHETKRLASSQERVASAVRDALGVVTNRLNEIEGLVSEAPARAFEPIRAALGRLDERVSLMEGTDHRASEHFEALMDSLGKRLTDVVGRIDELAQTHNKDPALREERVASIEAKLGSILKQLSGNVGAQGGSAQQAQPLPQAPVSPAKRPRVVVRAVAQSGTLDAALDDIRRKQSELGMPRQQGQNALAASNAAAQTMLRAELGALSDQLQRLEKGRVDTATLNDLLGATNEVRRLLADPTMPRLAARLEQGVADLTRRVDALAGTTVDRKEIAALTSVISDIRAKLSQPVSGPDSTSVERRIEALSAKIDDVMREPLGLVGQHLADLTARIGKAREGISPEAFSDMRAKLDRIAEQADRPPVVGHPAGNGDRALAAIRDKLDHLAERLDRTPPGLDGGALGELRDKIDRLSQSIADLAKQAPGNGNITLTEVRDRLDQLAERLDHGLPGIDAQAIAHLRDRLDTLSRSIEHFAERAPENSIALFEVRDRLDYLAHRLDGTPAGVDDRIVGELRDRMDRLSRSIEGMSAHGSSAGEATLAELRDRLDRLAQRLDTAATASDAGATAELRDRLDRLAQSIEQSALDAPDRIDRLLRQIAASIDMSRPQDGNSGTLKALERQVAALGERIDSAKDSGGAIGELERGVARLFTEVAETKAAAIKAAQTAVGGGAYQAKDAAAMRDERGAGDRDMLATLDQMNTTLERLMDRLSSLETRVWAPDETLSSYLPTGVGRAHSEPARAAEQPSSESVTEEDDMLRSGSTPAEKSRRADAGKRPIQPSPARAGAASSNEPLEPGSGRPISKPMSDTPLRATKEKVVAAPASASIAADPGAGSTISSTMSAQALIAAARRAAADTAARQQAAAAASASSSPLNVAKDALSTLRANAGAHKKPILLALIGLMVVFSAVGAGRLFLSGENAGVDQSIPATAAAPARAAPGEAAPAKPAAPAPADAATPAKQGSLQAPATSVAAEPTAPTFTKIGQATVASPSPAEAPLPVGAAAASLAPTAPMSSVASPPKQGTANPASIAALTPPDPSAPDFVSKLRLAANADDPIAEYELAARMYDGRGMARDTQGAARLFERAANQGLAPAQYRIANIYETGIGATKDLVLAKAWFEKAAARGNAKAMHNVGVYLAQGVQGKPDYAAAVNWFRKAAERNIRDSQYNLAILLARGLGTSRDFKASYVWFALAAREGDADSAKKRDEVAAHLTSAELDDAKTAVAQWKPIEVDRSANEVNVGDIKWDRFGPAATQAEQPSSSKL